MPTMDGIDAYEQIARSQAAACGSHLGYSDHRARVSLDYEGATVLQKR